jgi:hypothetical protein
VKGTIGIGKSMTILNFSKEIAKEEKREFVEWVKTDRKRKEVIAQTPEKYLIFVDERIALKDATDDKGVPLMDGNKINVGEFQIRYLEWVKTLILNIASYPDSMVIFFKDEINLAPPSIQASQYQMILDKSIDEISFSKNTFIIAAGNRQEDNSNIFAMSWALKNRFQHATLMPPSLPEWTEDFGIPYKINIYIMSFLQFKESYLFKLPEDLESGDDAFPTPRTIQFASEMIEGITDLDLIKEYVASSVGEAFAKEFVAWLKLTQTIDLKDILENPQKVKDIKGMDLQTSVISGIVDLYQRDNTILLKAIEVSMQFREEFSTYMLRLLKSINQSKFFIEVSKSEYFEKINEKFNKYVDKNY